MATGGGIRSKHFLRHASALRDVCRLEAAPLSQPVSITSSRTRATRLCFGVRLTGRACVRHATLSRKQGIERRGYDATPGVDGYPTDPNHPWFKQGK